MATIQELQKRAHENSKKHGFWTENQALPAIKIALLHSELSELLEVYRDGNAYHQCEKDIPHLTNAAEEAADVLIRLLDFCEGFCIDLESAVKAKMLYNESRPYKHGKAF